MARGIIYKTKEEIELIRESSLLVGKTLAEVAKVIKPGITTLALDKVAFEFINDNLAIPAFLNFNGFPNSLCISVNSQVVHGIPSNYELKDGDIVSVDCGVIKNRFFGDSAYTFAIGDVKPETQKLLDITKQCLLNAIELCVVNKRLGDISDAVQSFAESNGFSVVREYVGQINCSKHVIGFSSNVKNTLLGCVLGVDINPKLHVFFKHRWCLKWIRIVAHRARIS